MVVVVAAVWVFGDVGGGGGGGVCEDVQAYLDGRDHLVNRL